MLTSHIKVVSKLASKESLIYSSQTSTLFLAIPALIPQLWLREVTLSLDKFYHLEGKISPCSVGDFYSI